MRRSIVATLAIALGCGAGTAAQREFDGARAMTYAQAQVDFGPRVPNTEAHRLAGDWILGRLRTRVDAVEVQEFLHVTVGGDTLRLRNFIGRLRPEALERIVYLAHWDSRPRSDQSRNVGAQMQPVPGANDGASGVALLLGVADVLSQRPSEFGVDLVFVDGEDYGDFSGPDVLIGSEHYAATLDSTRLPLFGVVLDMIGDADLEIPQEANSVNAAPEVVTRVWNAARDLGYGHIFVERAGLAITDDHLPLIRAGVRAIDVIDFDYGPSNAYWHTPEDTPDKVSAESLQVVGDVVVTFAGAGDPLLHDHVGDVGGGEEGLEGQRGRGGAGGFSALPFPTSDRCPAAPLISNFGFDHPPAKTMTGPAPRPPTLPICPPKTIAARRRSSFPSPWRVCSSGS